VKPTYWNWEKTPCARVLVRVIGPIPDGWWCKGLEGTVRKAVRVEYGGSKFYLDNEDMSGWLKVTAGGGSPRWGHRSLSACEEIGPDPEEALDEERERVMRERAQIGRNDRCPCGSGLKFKQCCLEKRP
jgi:hypothetical protein